MGEKYTLYFAADKDCAIKHAPTSSVVLWPDADRWNDFGYRVLSGFLVSRFNQLPRVVGEDASAFIASNEKDCAAAIETVLAGRPIAPVPVSSDRTENERPWFATLLGSLDEYRRLVRALGAEEARLVLECMHDIAAEQLRGSPRTWLEAVMNSEGLQVAVLRPTVRYFAFRRARDVLLENEKSAIEMTRAQARVSFRLHSFSARHDVFLDFGASELFDRRINVLIGQNGVGKSQTLSQLVAALAGVAKTGNYVVPQGEFSRVVAFSGVPSQTSLPRRLRSQRNLQYRYFSLSPQRRVRKGEDPLTTALVDLTRDDVRIGGRTRLEIFADALGSWLPLEEICLPLRPDVEAPRVHLGIDRQQEASVPLSRLIGLPSLETLRDVASIDTSKPPIFFKGRGSGAPLSSGQELFFRFTLNLCAFVEVGTLVLVDEPENHLHPNFISQLMALLRTVLKLSGSFAVVATHSPFVVREVTRNDVVIMSRTDQGAALMRRPRLQTLGASVAAVSAYVFGDDTVPILSRLTVDALQSIANGETEETIERLQEDFSNEAISHIRSLLHSRHVGEDE